jgi:uncharacterized protein RhaS with RHS repeats
MGHRYYDPVRGRFLTRDPIGYAGGIHLYAFANNNPVMNANPMGLLSLTDLANFSSGFFDNVTFGLTGWLRNQGAERLGVPKVVHEQSGVYRAGDYTATGVQVATGVGGIAKAGGNCPGQMLRNMEQCV